MKIHLKIARNFNKYIIFPGKNFQAKIEFPFIYPDFGIEDIKIEGNQNGNQEIRRFWMAESFLNIYFRHANRIPPFSLNGYIKKIYAEK